MSRKVFYSFHYERDAWRAAQVRNSNVIADEDEYGVIDSVDWETIEREGDEAIKRWIDAQLKYTSVTVVLIGAQTADRDWVNYEILQSWKRGNALLGVRIHGMKNQDRETDHAGANPFSGIVLSDGTSLSELVEIHDWVSDDGRANLGTWVEDAYQDRQRYSGETQLAKQGTTSGVRVTAAAPAVISNPAKPWSK